MNSLWTGILGRVLPAALSLALSACAGMGEVVTPRPFALPRANFEPIAMKPRAQRVGEFLPWAEEQAELIVIDKRSRRLVLYRYGQRQRSYPVVLGRNPGRKIFEGDRRTPSGIYEIYSKHPSAKYDRFLALNYPNEEDLANYRSALSGGIVPASFSVPAGRGPGGAVGIHGSDKEDLNRLGIDWTFGCISLVNRDIEELYDEVGDGAMVVIRDDEQP